jgi:hypothetical protein
MSQRWWVRRLPDGFVPPRSVDLSVGSNDPEVVAAIETAARRYGITLVRESLPALARTVYVFGPGVHDVAPGSMLGTIDDDGDERGAA